jgi:copper ion binding protein
MAKETIKVEGMVCGHCEIAVKTAVRALPGVKKAKANHRTGNVKLDFDEASVSLDAIKEAITATGYTPRS